MSIRYRKVQDSRTSSKNFGQWYGRAIIMDEVSTKQLAEEISHSTTVTYTDVLAVLSEISASIKSHLQNSEKVVLDGLGSFRVGISTKPAATSAEFDSSKISGFHIIYAPERKFAVTGINTEGKRTGYYVKQLLDGITAKETPKNDVVETATEPAA
ncbi:MAG: HU family DNA-binding protein [Prevotella sp.]|jgi:predicted histone-like DNA-binding protein|nr:HU family DNA-binding protein [Prevotella sp.]